MCCASPLRTDPIQRSSSLLISQNCLSQIVPRNFLVSKHTCRCAILTKKWLQSFSHWNFPTVRRFCFFSSLAETPFCFFSAQSVLLLSAFRRAGLGVGRNWAGSAAAMGGGCLSEMQNVLVASRMSANHLWVLERGVYVRRRNGKALCPSTLSQSCRSATFSITTVKGLRHLHSLRLW